jgi:segregation and condensation protein A
VCRFLALLELFREGAVAFDQMTPLGELTIRWTGSDTGDITVGDEFDLPPDADAAQDDESPGYGEPTDHGEPAGDQSDDAADHADHTPTEQMDDAR